MIISHLQQGVAYQMRVKTKGDFGESTSQTVEHIAGSDPGKGNASITKPVTFVEPKKYFPGIS